METNLPVESVKSSSLQMNILFSTAKCAIISTFFLRNSFSFAVNCPTLPSYASLWPDNTVLSEWNNSDSSFPFSNRTSTAAFSVTYVELFSFNVPTHTRPQFFLFANHHSSFFDAGHIIFARNDNNWVVRHLWRPKVDNSTSILSHGDKPFQRSASNSWNVANTLKSIFYTRSVGTTPLFSGRVSSAGSGKNSPVFQD